MGEDKAALSSTVALLGGASVIWRGYSGTGKSHGAKLCVALLPEETVCRVDMVSALGIWSKDMVERITKATFVFFPEDQNASDNDEVVKVKKKWGDGDDAERAKSENYGNETSLTSLPCRTFISTAAITNEAHEKSFDLESARRVVKVNTDPSEASTGRVLDSKADALVRGRQNVRAFSPLAEAAVKKHVARVVLDGREAVQSVRFFGAPLLVAAIPKTFPESRSAFALFEKILLGMARFYAHEEVRVGTEVFLSPQRVAEAWSFYGDILVENALKWDTSDREILSAFPAPVWNGIAVDPASCLDLTAIMRQLKPYGLTDQALVKRQIGRLEMKGFLAQNEAMKTPKWHKTGLADVVNNVDWDAVVKACREAAPKHLEGGALAAYLAKCDEASGDKAFTSPFTGEPCPMPGTRASSPTTAPKAQPKGILSFGT